MKTNLLSAVLATICLTQAGVQAAPSSSAHYAILAEINDSGGGTSLSASYGQQGSLGGIAGDCHRWTTGDQAGFSWPAV